MHFSIFIFLMSFASSRCWRAMPVNQASFSQRKQITIIAEDDFRLDELLPRTSIHSIYKFGWCRPDVTVRQFLAKKAYFTLPDVQSTRLEFLYLIQAKNTRNFRLQCVVMRIMVPFKFLFYRSRIPIYYCQGLAYYLIYNMVMRLEVHEFYLHNRLNMPSDFFFEFYHPPTRDSLAKEIFHEQLYY